MTLAKTRATHPAGGPMTLAKRWPHEGGENPRGRSHEGGDWQQQASALRIIETELIKFALAEGHDIVNDKGTKTRVHTLTMRGARIAATRLFRSTMKIEQR